MALLSNSKLSIIILSVQSNLQIAQNVIDTDVLGITDRIYALEQLQKLEKSTNKLKLELLKRLDPDLPPIE